MDNKDITLELKKLLTKDFLGDENYDDLRRDIITEINSSSRTLEEQEFEAIAKKQRFERRTALSETSLVLSYAALVLPLITIVKFDYLTEYFLYFILAVELLLAGILVIKRLLKRTKYNPYILYYTLKLNCINQIREEHKLNANNEHHKTANKILGGWYGTRFCF